MRKKEGLTIFNVELNQNPVHNFWWGWKGQPILLMIHQWNKFDLWVE